MNVDLLHLWTAAGTFAKGVVIVWLHVVPVVDRRDHQAHQHHSEPDGHPEVRP